MKRVFLIALPVLFLAFTACKTKSEIRREQELENLKGQVREAREGRADSEATFEELRTEVARLSNLVEQQAALNRSLSDDLGSKVNTMQARVQALEQRAVAEDLSLKAPPPETEKASFERGKRFFDENKFDEAAEILKEVTREASSLDEKKRAQFLLAESYFGAKDYASAALEFAEFRKTFPKDPLVPSAIYRQASAFKSLGKNKEAKLFFQDLVDRYPTSPFSAKAKADLRKLK